MIKKHIFNLFLCFISLIILIFAYIISPPNLWQEMTYFEKGLMTELLVLFYALLSIISIITFYIIKYIWNLFAHTNKTSLRMNILSIIIKYLIFIIIVLGYILAFDSGKSYWTAYNPFIIIPVIFYTLFAFKGKVRSLFLLILFAFPLVLITKDKVICEASQYKANICQNIKYINENSKKHPIN